MRPFLERVTKDLVRRGVREGLLGGNGIWLALGSAAWLVRFLARSPAPRVVREELKVGETITVSSVAPPPFGRRARELAKSERKAAKSARKEIRHQRQHAAALPAPKEVVEGAGGGKAGKGGRGGKRSARA